MFEKRPPLEVRRNPSPEDEAGMLASPSTEPNRIQHDTRRDAHNRIPGIIPSDRKSGKDYARRAPVNHSIGVQAFSRLSDPHRARGRDRIFRRRIVLRLRRRIWVLGLWRRVLVLPFLRGRRVLVLRRRHVWDAHSKYEAEGRSCCCFARKQPIDYQPESNCVDIGLKWAWNTCADIWNTCADIMWMAGLYHETINFSSAGVRHINSNQFRRVPTAAIYSIS